MTERLTRVRAALAEEGLDAIWVSGPVDDVFGQHSQNRRYLSGFTGSAGHVIVTRDDAFISVDFRYVEQAVGEAAPRGFRVLEQQGAIAEWAPALVRAAALPGKTIGVSAADMSLAAFVALTRALEELPWGLRPRLGPASPIVENLRRQKDAEELDAIQEAIRVADAAYTRVAANLAPGQTEQDVARAVEAAVRDLGAQGVSFDTIVAAGAWSAMPHATPRAQRMAAGDMVVIDMGAQVNGYCSDLTRTTVLGPLDARFREIYEIVFEAQRAAIEGVEPGMTGVAADALARAVIEKAGYGEQFGHGLGHGVGLHVHESPYLGRTSRDTLEDGMVFTIEPGIYVPGWGGVRIEDVVILEHGRARVLSHAPKLIPQEWTP